MQCTCIFYHGFRLPVYEVDQTNLSSSSCTKIYPIHQRFSPGLLVIACEHKICYGFQIMRQRESTISIFNTLSTHFKRQPRIIIYDNAYNLHTTCTIRYLTYYYVHMVSLVLHLISLSYFFSGTQNYFEIRRF